MTFLERLSEEYLSEPEVCAFLGVSKATMQTRRSRGIKHPPFKRVGHTVIYPKKDFYAWLERTQTYRSVDDGERSA